MLYTLILSFSFLIPIACAAGNCTSLINANDRTRNNPRVQPITPDNANNQDNLQAQRCTGHYSTN